MIFPILIGAGVLALAWLYKSNSNPGIATQATAQLPAGFTPSANLVTANVRVPSEDFMFQVQDDPSTWPIVELNGEKWQVAPSYIGPVGIGQAKQIAESQGMQLPFPALVDAIWRVADLKVSPVPEPSDGTPKTMATPAVYLKHKTKVDALVDGRSFQLLAGTHKDVVVNDVAQPGLKAGGIGLYGWHAGLDAITKAPDGKLRTVIGGAEVHAPVTAGEGFVIQQPFGGHGLEWIDYSQGARLVKKVG